MNIDQKELRRKRISRKKQDNVHNVIAKDLRTPKYKMRVVQTKRNKNVNQNLMQKVRNGEDIDE